MTGHQQVGDEGSMSSRAGHDRAAAVDAKVHARHGTRIAAELEREPVWARDFNDLSYEARRLFSELFGTFLLVLAGAGAGVLDAATHGQIGRAAGVSAPAQPRAHCDNPPPDLAEAPAAAAAEWCQSPTGIQRQRPAWTRTGRV